MKVEIEFKNKKFADYFSYQILAENNIDSFEILGFTTFIFKTKQFKISNENGEYYIALPGKSHRILAQKYMSFLSIDNEVLFEQEKV